MKLFKKTILSLLIVGDLFFNIFNANIGASSLVTPYTNGKPINAAVLLFKFGDPYTDKIKESLENLEKENKTKIKFTFFDGENSKAIQDQILSNLYSDNYELLLLDLSTPNETSLSNIVTSAKATNKSVILFDVEPTSIPSIAKTYNKFFIVSTDSKQGAILQGKKIIDIWNNNKSILDKNNNNTLEYIILQGKINKASLDRTKYSIETIKNAGINTREMVLINADWDKELARKNVENLFLKFGNRIEAIIANNDAMAIGAIEALQKYGYNLGDKNKFISVFGIDGLPEAKALIDKGIMSGTVLQNPNEIANALYVIGLNLVENNPPLENTKYTLSNLGISVELPYYEFH